MSSPVPYCHNPYHYQRRLSREVKVGKSRRRRRQPPSASSPCSPATPWTPANASSRPSTSSTSAAKSSASPPPPSRDAANLKHIKSELLAAGCDVPIVADIHFKPDAAIEAAQWVEKVRVNPGNFADKKKFAIREYTDDQYEEELARIDETFKPLVDICKARGIAMRIGTNHGSLSDRIMNRFGDTPLGMVESAVEFARIARKYGYHDFVFSMKSSNPKVMINAYRMLAARLLELGPDWNYPLHLGVTEAGDGEDGRIKSAIGIGALLADGIGDTIRVSLTEDSVHEIPVARALVSLAGQHAKDELPPQQPPLSFDPFVFNRRASEIISLSEQNGAAGGPSPLHPRRRDTQYVSGHRAQTPPARRPSSPDFVIEKESVIEVDPRDNKALDFLANAPTPHLVTIADGCTLSPIVAYRYLAAQIPARHPILLKDTFTPAAPGAKPDVLDTMLSARREYRGSSVRWNW